jgi:hypothetical protein
VHAAEHLVGALNTGPSGAWNRTVLATIAGVHEDVLGAQRSRHLTGGLANAFLHVAGSCMLTRALGPDEAQEITDAHEVKTNKDDPVDKGDSHVDQNNNALGRRLGSDQGNASKSCEDLAERSLANGSAEILVVP